MWRIGDVRNEISETSQAKGDDGEGESQSGQVIEVPARGNGFREGDWPVKESVEGVDVLG